MSRKHILIFTFLGLILAAVFAVSCLAGAGKLTIRQVFSCLFNPARSSWQNDILWQLRLPRIVLGIFVGAGLAVTGAVLQAMLRNPLAEPYTIGISGASAFGVTLGLVFDAGAALLPLFSFAAATAAMILIYSLVSRKRFTVSAIILGGVILSFFFSSCIRLIFSLAKSEKVHGALLWLMGDLSCADPLLIKLTSLVVLGGIAVFILLSRDINILTLGEEKAVCLGVSAEALNKLLFIISAVIIAFCVAAAGVISFVGLVIPHLMRYLGGTNYRYLIPASALGGACFLALCDTLARTVILPLEFPVGVITGIIGGIFFLIYLFFSKKIIF